MFRVALSRLKTSSVSIKHPCRVFIPPRGLDVAPAPCVLCDRLEIVANCKFFYALKKVRYVGLFEKRSTSVSVPNCVAFLAASAAGKKRSRAGRAADWGRGVPSRECAQTIIQNKFFEQCEALAQNTLVLYKRRRRPIAEAALCRSQARDGAYCRRARLVGRRL